MVQKTITIKPTTLLKRGSTSYWKNYTTLWDNKTYLNLSNNEIPSSAQVHPEYGKTSSTKGAYFLLPTFPTLPNNAIFKSIICHIYICRYGNTSAQLQVNLGSSSTNTSSGTRINLTDTSIIQGPYNITTDCQITYTSQSLLTTLQSIQYPYIFLLGTDSFQSTLQYITEISIDINYEVPFDSQIYIGNKNATEIYVGNTKSTATYLGNNQIL